MTPLERSAVIKELAVEVGFDRCGIAPAGPHPHGDYLRQWLADGKAGTMAYLHRHIESRIDVRAWLPQATSVIVVALNYYQPAPAPPSDDAPRGRVAMYAWGRDYHEVVREKLERLVAAMRHRVDVAFEARVCVDTSAIVERELAMAAGVGWIGKNTLVLNESLGSFFVLGEVIVDLPLAPDSPATDHCGTCTRCLDACPTSAFPAPYKMDARRCISYLTIEHRGEIAPELADKMGDWVFGCDDCQTVCPFNRQPPMTNVAEFTVASGRGGGAVVDEARPSLRAIENWDETTYRDATHAKAQRRAKLEMWRRNAVIAGRNSNGSMSSAIKQ